jgi:hypothetical protein
VSCAVPDATITYYDGNNFLDNTPTPTASGIHAGAMTITGTYFAGSAVTLDAGWPGEPYHVELSPFASYQRGVQIQLDDNNVALAVNWVCVIAW